MFISLFSNACTRDGRLFFFFEGRRNERERLNGLAELDPGLFDVVFGDDVMLEIVEVEVSCMENGRLDDVDGVLAGVTCIDIGLLNKGE